MHGGDRSLLSIFFKCAYRAPPKMIGESFAIVGDGFEKTLFPR